jgi:hyperosmotically inducible periplasmic protein
MNEHIKMKISDGLKFIAISMLLAVGLSACDGSGPAETAGKNIDQTMDKVGKKIGDAADKVSETVSADSNKVSVAISDTEITARVKAAIFAEPGLGTLQISVDTVKGVVTLSGSVDSKAHSDTAKAMAEEVSGVSQVNNHLEIKGS